MIPTYVLISFYHIGGQMSPRLVTTVITVLTPVIKEP